jgi:HAD superfamily hydrolase (TIGR01509 family)
MSPADLVIFDCDGVLVDTERIAHQVLVDMLAELGITLSLEDAVARFMGTSSARSRELVGELVDPMPAAEFMSRFVKRTQLAYTSGLTAVPGIEAVLARLQTPCCVASNGSQAKMNLTLARTGLRPRFEGRMYSADEVAHPKPAPDLFLHAARCQRAEPARCIVVEDSPTGIAAARAAGMRAYGYTAMTPASRLLAAGSHAVFSEMSELPDLLAARI